MKTRYKNYLIAICGLLLTLLSSCSDDYVKGVFIASNNEYALNMQTASLQNIPAEGGVIDTRIEATPAVEWSIQGLPDWLTTTTLSGTGAQEIKFNAAPNPSFTASRTHIFNIVSKNAGWQQTVPVSATQLKQTTEFSISPDDVASWTFSSEGGSKELKIISNSDWSAECKESFVSLSQTEGSGNSTITITVAPFNSADLTANREAHVYFREKISDNVTSVLTITQTPLQTSVTTETIDFTFERNAYSQTFVRGEEVSGGYEVQSSVPWLKITKNNPIKVDITLTVESNDNESERTTVATLRYANSNEVRYNFNVRQHGNSISVDPPSISFNANGGSQNVTVNSSSDWTTINLNDWIKVNKAGSICVISVDENNSLDERTGDVYFNFVNERGEPVGNPATLNVGQAGRKLSVDNDVLQFGPEASSLPIMISGDTKWTLAASADWITLSATEGTGDQEVMVTVTDNLSSSSRTGKITCTYHGKTSEIEVVQATAFLNTPSTPIELLGGGDEAVITVESNLSWEATSSEPWLTLSRKNVGEGEELVLTASYNASTEAREAVVTIKSILGENKINVRQEAPIIKVEYTSMLFVAEGGSDFVGVIAEGDYTVTSSASWISCEKGDGILTVSVSKNTGEQREGTVTLKLKDVDISKTITVTQEMAPPTLSVSQTTVNFDAAGGTSAPITVTANDSFTVTTSDSWLKCTTTGNSFKITASENTGSARQGKVTVKLSKYNLSETITVYQAPPQFVDLGLPSGTLWCTTNVGATLEQHYGTYMTLAESKEMIPAGCARPTSAQGSELYYKCTWTWTTVNTVYGCRVTGPNGNSIFLPACGYAVFHTIAMCDLYHERGTDGYYWIPFGAGYICFNSSGPLMINNTTDKKFTLRCVKK